MKERHHPLGPEAHHQTKGLGGKNWKEHLFEFFMLFFAVFCGFQAEYLLEHKIERDGEKQFIVSMVNEMELDSKELALKLADSMKWSNMVTLARYLDSNDGSLASVKRIVTSYQSSRWAMYMTFNKSTLTQLKSAGNMRLIRNLSVVDSLNQLNNLINCIEYSLNLYNNAFQDFTRLAAKTFDWQYVIKDGYWIPTSRISEYRTTKIITADRKILAEFSNHAFYTAALLGNYYYYLVEYRKFSLRLSEYLKKEYHLKDEIANR